MQQENSEVEPLNLWIAPAFAGRRLDQVLAELCPDYSRSRLQQWIKEGRVLLDGAACRPRDRVFEGQRVELRARLEPRQGCLAEAIPLEIVHQDAALLVVNKPPGLVVHPAAGNPDGTLQNALLFLDPELARLPRAGIVHRLDKDTSGLLVVARTAGAHRSLVEQLQARRIKREYRAVVNGLMTAGGTVDQPIGRHPTQRTRMAVVTSGKPAVTHFRVLERFRAHSYLSIRLESGRTHQIRVHMAYLGYPLLGDPLYGGRLRLPRGAGEELVQGLRSFRRQALHAQTLGLEHPETGEWVEWEAPLPDDMQALLRVLRGDAQGASGP